MTDSIQNLIATYVQALAGNPIGIFVLGLIGILVALILLRRFSVGWTANEVRQGIIDDLSKQLDNYKKDLETSKKELETSRKSHFDKDKYAEELSAKLMNAHLEVHRYQQDKLADELFLSRLHMSLEEAIAKLDTSYPDHGVTIPVKPKAPSDMFGPSNKK